MREPTIARNYAQALVELAAKADDLEGWGTMISDVADAVQTDPRLMRFLEQPRLSTREKNAVLESAFVDRMPRTMLRFLQAVVTNRRQHAIPEIASQYHEIVDEVKGRVHARVTVAREPSDATRATIVQQLSRALGKRVVPHFTLNPEILGGTIVRVGDTVMDGSVRRRLATLKSRMQAGSR